MAARRRIASLVSNSLLGSYGSPALLLSLGRYPNRVSRVSSFSTAAVVEEPITPPVQISNTQLLINGQFVDAASGKTFPTLDPRTGEVIANVAEGNAEDINRAVCAARKAFDEGPWPRMTPYERLRVLLRFADLLLSRHVIMGNLLSKLLNLNYRQWLSRKNSWPNSSG